MPINEPNYSLLQAAFFWGQISKPLFAKSGLGKTSLIDAGISEPLRKKGFLPLKVRFNREGISPVQTIFESIRDRVEQAGMDWEEGEKNTLWHYFKTAAFWSEGDSLMTPVLILDQFEEFFAFHEPEARNGFILQLADLVNGTIPSALRQAVREGEPFPYSENPPEVKVLISIRENYLDLLEELSVELPDILCSRFRLSELTRDQARDAITRPPQVRDEQIGTAGFSYSDEALNSMLDYLSKVKEKGREIRRDEVESFQLQLLCRHIESNIRAKIGEGIETDGPVVRERDLGGEAGMQKVLQNFYENRLAELKTRLRKWRVRQLCERGLVSASDRRLSLEEEEIGRKYKVSPSLLTQLVDSRLLRGENRVGSVYYELSHDTLVAPILLSRRKRRASLKKYVLFSLLPVLITAVLIAIASYKRNLDLKYEEAVNHLRHGYRLDEKGNFDGAIASYKKALEIDPEYITAKMNLAEIYLTTEQLEKALELVKEVLTEKEMLIYRIHAMKSISISVLFLQGQQPAAIEELEKLITYYRGIPKDYENSWNYSSMKSFITRTNRLNEQDRALLLAMIDLLEAPKEERGKKLKTLETMLLLRK